MTDRLTPVGEIPVPTGTATLSKLAFDGGDLTPLWLDTAARSDANPGNAALLLDLSVIEQLLDNADAGLKHQTQALNLQRIYQSSWPASPKALRVLAFVAPGGIGINTPIEFLLRDLDVVLYQLYVVPGQVLPQHIPAHDIAIVAVGESDQHVPIMQEIERRVPAWPCPVLNPPGRIMRLSREETWRILAGAPGIVMPATVPVDRARLDELGHGSVPLQQLLPDGAFPLIVRPVGSHAGRGLEQVTDTAALLDYLRRHPEGNFYISRYVDYSSADGLFRKYRIVWVDGQPFPCHMAIADQWDIWYYNANMAASDVKRAEEAEFMTAFDRGFGQRHAAALAALAKRFDLDYVGIDCAETPDGRLMVFEADVAMIVHDMDALDLYPYKSPQMQKMFAAFLDMLRRKSISPTTRAG